MTYFGYSLDIHGWKTKPETEPENRGWKIIPKTEPTRTETRGYPTRNRPTAILRGKEYFVRLRNNFEERNCKRILWSWVFNTNLNLMKAFCIIVLSCSTNVQVVVVLQPSSIGWHIEWWVYRCKKRKIEKIEWWVYLLLAIIAHSRNASFPRLLFRWRVPSRFRNLTYISASSVLHEVNLTVT